MWKVTEWPPRVHPMERKACKQKNSLLLLRSGILLLCLKDTIVNLWKQMHTQTKRGWIIQDFGIHMLVINKNSQSLNSEDCFSWNHTSLTWHLLWITLFNHFSLCMRLEQSVLLLPHTQTITQIHRNSSHWNLVITSKSIYPCSTTVASCCMSSEYC